jgi:hypothetical protein
MYRDLKACMQASLLRSALLATLVTSLSACVVVPVDPRTGQPLQSSQATLAAPVVVAAPAGPSVLSARLYPINEAAQRAGVLTAIIVDQHSGRGTITVGYLGDTLQGEATRLDGPGRKGIANAAGSRGVSAQCNYAITSPGMGAGSCNFSDGAQFRMHFGN